MLSWLGPRGDMPCDIGEMAGLKVKDCSISLARSCACACSNHSFCVYLCTNVAALVLMHITATLGRSPGLKVKDSYSSLACSCARACNSSSILSPV